VGQSFQFRQSALTVVLERLPYTITLAVAAIVITAVLAIPLGVWMARRANTAGELGANIATIAGQSMPDFWIGFVLLIVFAVNLQWFPSSGFTSVSSLVLPTLTIVVLQVALISRLVRREMSVNLNASYVTIARSRGVSERRLTWRYAFSNSAIPVVTALGTRFAAMLNGVVIVEVVFRWPGVGQLVVDALERRDLPVIQATVLVTVLLALFVQLAVDLIYPLLDPRVRLGEGAR
jgi:peptide/nickel transport system permease protein